MNTNEGRQLVKDAIKDQGLKKTWVAEKIGVSSNALGSYLSGKTKLGKSAQILLCQVLNLNAEKAA